MDRRYTILWHAKLPRHARKLQEGRVGESGESGIVKRSHTFLHIRKLQESSTQDIVAWMTRATEVIENSAKEQSEGDARTLLLELANQVKLHIPNADDSPDAIREKLGSLLLDLEAKESDTEHVQTLKQHLNGELKRILSGGVA